MVNNLFGLPEGASENLYRSAPLNGRICMYYDNAVGMAGVESVALFYSAKVGLGLRLTQQNMFYLTN